MMLETMKAAALAKDHITGIKHPELQGYDEPFHEHGLPYADADASVPHRRLTSMELVVLDGAFWAAEEKYAAESDSVYATLRRLLEEYKVPREERLEALDAASNNHWNFAMSHGILAFLAGQREGFRLAVAAVTRAAKDPVLATAIMGALVDDQQMDKLIGQFATGRVDPEFFAEEEGVVSSDTTGGEEQEEE